MITPFQCVANMKKEMVFTISITSHLVTGAEKLKLMQSNPTLNSFSCKINGQLFEPCNLGDSDSPTLFGGYSNNFSIVRITAKCSGQHPYKYVIIELNNFTGTGEYLLSDSNNDCRYEEFYPDNIYKSTLTRIGKVIITKDDRVNFIISGNFEFTAANTTNPLDIVNISMGSFYMKF